MAEEHQEKVVYEQPKPSPPPRMETPLGNSTTNYQTGQDSQKK